MNTFWREILDPQLQKLQNSQTFSDQPRTARAQEDWEIHKDSLFWMKYHSTLGNYKIMFPVMMCIVFPILIFILDVAPYYILQIPNHHHYSLWFYCLEMAHFVCYLVIFGNIWKWIRRIQSVADSYGIGTELQQIEWCFAIFVLLGQIAEVLIYALRLDASYFVLSATVCRALSILPSLYIGSLFVLRRLFSDYGRSVTLRRTNFEEQEKMDRFECIVFCGCPPKEEEEEECDAAAVAKAKCADAFTLDEVLSMKIGFEKFTQFLIAEWSVENILFLVEVKQYKARCRELLSYSFRVSLLIDLSPNNIRDKFEANKVMTHLLVCQLVFSQNFVKMLFSST